MIKNFNIPNWDQYFLMMAYYVSMRSKDSQTKHGAVIVGPDNGVLSTGYNSFPALFDDSILPDTRPKKYPFMAHSERNALAFCPIRPKGATIYVTGPPCNDCLIQIIQSGISSIKFGSSNSKMVDSKMDEVCKTLIKHSSIEYIQLKPEFKWFEETLKWHVK